MEEKGSPQIPEKDPKDFTQWGWKHPYMIYLWGVLGLFIFLVVMAYLAITNDWLPTR